MTQRTIFFISDHTGVTAETLGHSLLTQFDGQDLRQVTVPFIDTDDKARETVQRINEAARLARMRPIIFSTMLNDGCREIVKKANGLHLDIFNVFLEPLEKEFGQKGSHTGGRAHGMSDFKSYMKRIDATNFALTNDDGGFVQNYATADIILVGVSRSGKTPTCLYLALQYGIYAANFPLTDTECESGTLPDILLKHKKKLLGLTIEPKRLRHIRKERRPLGRYSAVQQVRFELRESEKIFKRYGISYINTTEFSIEEIASRILENTGVERRVRT